MGLLEGRALMLITRFGSVSNKCVYDKGKAYHKLDNLCITKGVKPSNNYHSNQIPITPCLVQTALLSTSQTVIDQASSEGEES